MASLVSSKGSSRLAVYLLCIHGSVLHALPSAMEMVLMGPMALCLALNVGIKVERKGSTRVRTSNTESPNLGISHLEHIGCKVQVARQDVTLPAWTWQKERVELKHRKDIQEVEKEDRLLSASKKSGENWAEGHCQRAVEGEPKNAVPRRQVVAMCSHDFCYRVLPWQRLCQWIQALKIKDALWIRGVQRSESRWWQKSSLMCDHRVKPPTISLYQDSHLWERIIVLLCRITVMVK